MGENRHGGSRREPTLHRSGVKCFIAPVKRNGFYGYSHRFALGAPPGNHSLGCVNRLIPLVVALLAAIQAPAAFEQPNEAARLAALGDLSAEPAELRRLLAPDDNFFPITLPGANDWLGVHRERGQTFAEYQRSGANRPDATRRIIYLLPLGEFWDEATPSLEALRTYAAAFFQMEVKILAPYRPHEDEFTPRKNPHSGQRQILAPDVMKFLQTRLPADAYCLLGITMADLYPQASWNFVFGQASLAHRVGVYSFVRYDPEFWQQARGRDYQGLILRRSAKVLVHETAHMFGLPHCIYYDCVLNGSNHLEETDAKPQHLCPVCLRKMHHAAGFDAVKRYEELARFYHRQKWYEESDWVKRQLARPPP
jgi:archaemetzincin